MLQPRSDKPERPVALDGVETISRVEIELLYQSGCRCFGWDIMSEVTFPVYFVWN